MGTVLFGRLIYAPIIICLPLAFMWHPSFGPFVGDDDELGKSLGMMFCFIGLMLVGTFSAVIAMVRYSSRLADNVKASLEEICGPLSSATVSYIVKEEMQLQGKRSVRVMYIEVSSLGGSVA